MKLRKYYDEEVEFWFVSDDSNDVGRDIGGPFEWESEADSFINDFEFAETKFNKLDRLIEAVGEEHRRLSGYALQEGEKLDAIGLLVLPHSLRWKLHVAACSITDYTFWAYKLEEGNEWYRVYEVETGIHAEGTSARHALENYFKHSFPDVLKLPRGSDE